MNFAAFLTDFADQAVILPLLATIGVGLALASWYRAAAAWVVAISATLAVMLALKLVFIACGDLVAGGLHSPSGHTASAAAAFGGFAGLIARLRTGSWRWTIPLAAAVAVAVGLSRLALHVHTPLEVVIAGIVGVLGATALVALAGHPPSGLRLRPLLASLVFVSLLFHGFHLPAEAAIRDFAALHFWPLSTCLAAR